MEKSALSGKNSESPVVSARETAAVGEINVSGHRQELHRHFNLWSICGLALTTGNTWAALGGSIVMNYSSRISPSAMHTDVAQVVALYNGGRPGAIYELCVHQPADPQTGTLTMEPASPSRSSTGWWQLPLPSLHRQCLRRAGVRQRPARMSQGS